MADLRNYWLDVVVVTCPRCFAPYIVNECSSKFHQWGRCRVRGYLD